MKLLRLKLNTDFRSLKAGFELDFRKSLDDPGMVQFQPFCFAGLNGSGKSNVLEALANILFHLEFTSVRFKPLDFDHSFDRTKGVIDAYELEYLIGSTGQKTVELLNLTQVLITKEKDKIPQMLVREYPVTNDIHIDNFVSFESKSQREPASTKEYLPDLVVGYSSGENEILSLPFIKTRLIHFDEYHEATRENFLYDEPESSLLYIDAEMSQAVLLVNLIFGNKEQLFSLSKDLGVLGVRSFRLILRDASILNNRYSLLYRLEESLEKLKKCALGWYEDVDEKENDTIILDFYVNEGAKAAFRYHFKDAFELFRLFQILYTLNYYKVDQSKKREIYDSDGLHLASKMGSLAPEEKVFVFEDFFIIKMQKQKGEPEELLLRSLSDGEHQFLHTMGICLILENKRTLLLLDEPETHFNPDWRSKFINVLNKSIAAGGGNNLMKDVLLTSHSPFIISDCLPNNVIIFKRDETTGELEVKNAREKEFNTYGSSIEIIMDEIFNNKQSIGDLSFEVLEEVEQGQIRNEEDLKRAKAKLRILGDSIEKDLLLARLNQQLPPDTTSGGEELPVVTPTGGGEGMPIIFYSDEPAQLREGFDVPDSDLPDMKAKEVEEILKQMQKNRDQGDTDENAATL